MKKHILISLLLISTLCIFSGCRDNSTENTTETENNYAINDVKTDDSIDESSDSSEIEVAKPHSMQYNVVPDERASVVQNINTIAIDGKLIEFPSDYNTITSTFGELSLESYNDLDMSEPVTGDSIGTSFTLVATPTTGDGIIKFTFSSTNGSSTALSEMTCTGFTIQGGNYENSKVMTCALPGNIFFGASIDDIKKAFGTNFTSKSNVSKDSWMLFYELDNVNLQFAGYNNGLYLVAAQYK